ncbi:YgcG family protein [Halopseudomonas sp.]|uniref:TPM domain-containing protein n=1 Tax=Halopseudomonas sp. TaxID=2901191 RepID=UPI003563C319
MRRLLVAWHLVALLLLSGLAAAQVPSVGDAELPELTGRVVDQAEMVDPATETRLTQMLAAHEQATGEQVVVVTLPDLQGRSIEEFGVALGRAWGIGQADEDTGALLIVARDDRKIRIEVGYGLEGRLTDAQSSAIINSIITPAFRAGNFEQGIAEGAAAMVQVLGGDPLLAASGRPVAEEGDKPPGGLFIILLFVVLSLIRGAFGGRGGRGGRGFGSAILAGALLGGMGRGGGGGGGFGGGGGGFGGGGASGGW